MNVIRNLAALLIIMMILPICMLGFRFTANIPFNYTEVFDELSLCQLRDTLLLAYDMEVSYDSLHFIYCNKEFSLSLVNEKLLMQPGTQIFLDGVEELYFTEKRGCIYVVYTKKGCEYERVLASAAGLYLDEFSDCDVCDVGTDSSEERLSGESEYGPEESE